MSEPPQGPYRTYFVSGYFTDANAKFNRRQFKEVHIYTQDGLPLSAEESATLKALRAAAPKKYKHLPMEHFFGCSLAYYRLQQAVKARFGESASISSYSRKKQVGGGFTYVGQNDEGKLVVTSDYRF